MVNVGRLMGILGHSIGVHRVCLYTPPPPARALALGAATRQTKGLSGQDVCGRSNIRSPTPRALQVTDSVGTPSSHVGEREHG